MSEVSEQSLKDQLSEATQEIGGLKDQVSQLESKVSDLQQQKIDQGRYAAIAHIKLHSYFGQLALHGVASENGRSSQFINNANACIRFTKDESVRALAQIEISSNPQQIADDWLNRCKNFFRERGGFNVFQ